MKREIKFRAWDKENREMVIEDTSVVSPRFSMFITEYNQNYNNFELMQYTGLKDKNGKEIYEGDIMETSGEVKMEIDGCECTGIIFGYSFEMKFLKDKGEWVVDEEIIGNKWENPELLEERSKI